MKKLNPLAIAASSTVSNRIAFVQETVANLHNQNASGYQFTNSDVRNLIDAEQILTDVSRRIGLPSKPKKSSVYATGKVKVWTPWKQSKVNAELKKEATARYLKRKGGAK